MIASNRPSSYMSRHCSNALVLLHEVEALTAAYVLIQEMLSSWLMLEETTYKTLDVDDIGARLTPWTNNEPITYPLPILFPSTSQSPPSTSWLGSQHWSEISWPPMWRRSAGKGRVFWIAVVRRSERCNGGIVGHWRSTITGWSWVRRVKRQRHCSAWVISHTFILYPMRTWILAEGKPPV